MEENQNLGQPQVNQAITHDTASSPGNGVPPSGPEDPPGQGPDKKKILIIGVAVLFVIVIAVVSVLLSSGGQRSNTSPSGGSSPSNPTRAANLSPTSSSGRTSTQSPTIVAKSFYNWYVNHPSPIKSGAYETREDTTAEFKTVMGSFVLRGIDPGYDHVFCEISSLPKNVTPAEPTYNEDKKLALVMFKNSSGLDLFQMKLESIRGKWLVADVWCP